MSAERSPAPRVKVHEDGRIAVRGTGAPWLIVTPCGWFVDVDDERDADYSWVVGVSGPGWRDAAVVPLPEPYPDQPIWEVGFGMVSADCPEVFIDDRPLVPAQARQYAAALLAAADEVDRQAAAHQAGQR